MNRELYLNPEERFICVVDPNRERFESSLEISIYNLKVKGSFVVGWFSPTYDKRVRICTMSVI